MRVSRTFVGQRIGIFGGVEAPSLWRTNILCDSTSWPRRWGLMRALTITKDEEELGPV
jgi:hypothetical protein